MAILSIFFKLLKAGDDFKRCSPKELLYWYLFRKKNSRPQKGIS